MQNFSQLKQEFLKKWLKGLKICSSPSKKMGILERKNAIKLSADLAMAFARKGRTYWSRAVIAKASRNSNNDMTLIKNASKQRFFQSKKIMKRSQNVHRVLLRNKSLSRKVLPNSMAKRLVKKRTQVLKRLVPGGDQCLDEVSLMRETLDYIISLRAQIDVMRCLAGAK
ncbi:hypothetical protein L484_023022 [Morus notabilis]|uniref:IBH1-like N-terminal domain-containing protein n=1 Tax=Morus notabilis TaxID=981085 RepID=W9RK42_9ROSA|nr:transcription factor IBH1-like 1 [Morus notabilis]EXB94914.1 hypothetical protein L484_023022 [Morus notabilis]